MSCASSFSLKPIDIEFMRKLHNKVNLVPVIAKSDTMTDEEIVAFKRRILDDIAYHNVRIFQPPVYDDDEETVQENEEILVSSRVRMRDLDVDR